MISKLFALIVFCYCHLFCFSQMDSTNCFEFNSKRAKTIEEFKLSNYLDSCVVPAFEAMSIQNDSIIIPNKHKPYTLLVFWFLSCPPCLSEVPYLIKLQERFPESLQIIGVTYEKKEAVSKFSNNHNINYPIISDASRIIDKYYLNGYPKNFLIDTSGIILIMARGFPNENDEKMIAINNILSSKK